jgi:hypothetical protein
MTNHSMQCDDLARAVEHSVKTALKYLNKVTAHASPDAALNVLIEARECLENAVSEAEEYEKQLELENPEQD